jgi:hypothetical protein
MDRSAEREKEGVWNKADDGTEEEDDDWGPGWPSQPPLPAPHVNTSLCPVVPCPYCCLGVPHESSLARVQEHWSSQLRRFNEVGDSWYSIFMQSVAFTWICHREAGLQQDPDLLWHSLRFVSPSDAMHAQTSFLMNEHQEAPRTSLTTDMPFSATLPPPPPPPGNCRMAPWHAQGGSDSSAGTSWQPREFVQPALASTAALPGKEFAYEYSGGEAKKKKYRPYDDDQQRVLWEAYLKNEDRVSFMIDKEYTYTVFFSPTWVQKSHATGYERAVRLRDC